MLQDILHGRITEIDAINGALVREGERRGVPTPVNRTLTLLVKALERNAADSSDRRQNNGILRLA
jgi:2-dehydropantoate 2-reductase